MKVAEILQEETLQAALKRLLKPEGTIQHLMGRDAKAAAELLNCKTSDQAYTLRAGSPMTTRLLKTMTTSHPFARATTDDHGMLVVIRMPGGAKVLIADDGDQFLLTNDWQKDELVEELIFRLEPTSHDLGSLD